MMPEYMPLTLSASVADWIARRVYIWREDRRQKRNLAARKLLRPYKQAAAQRGWQTRKAK